MLVIRSLIFNICGYSIIAIGCIFNSLLGAISPQATIKTWNYFFIPMFAWSLEHIAGIKIELRGQQYINQDCGIYAGKHESAVETFVLTKYLKKASYVLKKELAVRKSLDELHGVDSNPKTNDLVSRIKKLDERHSSKAGLGKDRTRKVMTIGERGSRSPR